MRPITIKKMSSKGKLEPFLEEYLNEHYDLAYPLQPCTFPVEKPWLKEKVDNEMKF